MEEDFTDFLVNVNHANYLQRFKDVSSQRSESTFCWLRADCTNHTYL